MFEDYYMTADEVAKALKISKSFAYKVIRKMNAELQEQGFFTMAGKVNKQFFLDKTCYDAAKVKELALSALAQKQIDYISGKFEETTPEQLEVTEQYSANPQRSKKILHLIIIGMICIGCILLFAEKTLTQSDIHEQKTTDQPKQEIIDDPKQKTRTWNISPAWKIPLKTIMKNIKS